MVSIIVTKDKKQEQKKLSVDQVFKLGSQHHLAGRLSEAENCYKKLLEVDANHYGAWNQLGLIAYQKNNFNAAIEFIGKALTIDPNFAQAHNNMGNVLMAQEKREEAVASYQRAIANKPDYAEAYFNQGNALSKLGKLDAAVNSFQQAITNNPNYVKAYNNLGNTLKSQGKLEEAAIHFKHVLTLNPGLAEGHNNLGIIFHSRGENDKAIACYKRAIENNPELAQAHNNFGNALAALSKYEEAIASFQRAIAIDPNYADALNNLGNVFISLGRPHEAIANFSRALAIHPEHAEAFNNLSNALKDQGDIEKAISGYQQTIAIKPTFIEAYSNRLLTMQYSTSIDNDVIFKEHCIWEERHAITSYKSPPFENDRNPNRRLKIAYVSPDFRNHSVAFFLEPILAHHDGEQYEITCYSLVANPDGTTQRMKALARHWISIVGMTDEEVATRIRDDGIDILVDLAGHTGSNRLPIFTHKSAPIQVSYLGYPNTTGLSTMDYRVSDAHADPPGKTDKWHTEKLIRLKDTAWCYRSVEKSPEVSMLPAKAKKYITFGSFNAFPKLNEKVLKLWVKLLDEVAHSRLLLKAKSLVDNEVKKRVIALFGDEGIPPERIHLAAQEPSYHRHLERYHEVDIALDTYPYHGTTTTCEALWMGVPVVTLEGETHRSRVGVSLLNQVGLEHLIAKTPDEYIHIASTLASDLETLEVLRQSLRSRMQASPLMDEVSFTKELESAYRDMWQKWIRE